MPKFNIEKMFEGVGKKWIQLLTSETMQPFLTQALRDLSAAEPDVSQITPPPNEIFNFARHTKYPDVKVVVIGQDPYPKKGDAHGLAFSCKGEIPASLRNVYACLEEQKLISAAPTTADLTNWAEQGVLLLNSSLTTRVGTPNAHRHVWKNFTDELIRLISYDRACGPGDSLIFMLWGAHAREKKVFINEDCVVYEWLHSPLAQEGVGEKDRFIHCDHFSSANMMLGEMGLAPIVWDLNPAHVAYTDGACSNNGKGMLSSAGFSTYFARGPLTGTVKYGKLTPTTLNGVLTYGTNQRAEGLGIIVALETAPLGKLTVVTDSEFWIRMIEEFMPEWANRGTDFKTKKNHDLTRRLWALVEPRIDARTLTMVHVKSHGKDKSAPAEHVAGNEVADRYAVKAREREDFAVVTEIVG